MTGFGTAEGTVGTGRLRLEIRTVNHRHLSVQFKAPGEVMALEAEVRERLRAHLARGHATVSARWTEEPGAKAWVAVDEERARAVVEALRAVGRSLGITGDVDLATVARIPEVVRITAADGALDHAAVLAVVDEAVRGCVAMREREGAVLAADLRERVAALRRLAKRIAERAPARLVVERERLSKNVAELASGATLDPSRLAQEIAFIADRLDITEELVRLDSHLAAVEQALDGGGQAVGKQLGFLLQELGREVNTIGSKANDAPMTESVIAAKGELERMREQVENLE